MSAAAERERDAASDQRAPLDRHQARFLVPLPRAGISVDAGIAERLSQAFGRVVAVRTRRVWEDLAAGGLGRRR